MHLKEASKPDQRCAAWHEMSIQELHVYHARYTGDYRDPFEILVNQLYQCMFVECSLEETAIGQNLLLPV